MRHFGSGGQGAGPWSRRPHCNSRTVHTGLFLDFFVPTAPGLNSSKNSLPSRLPPRRRYGFRSFLLILSVAVGRRCWPLLAVTSTNRIEANPKPERQGKRAQLSYYLGLTSSRINAPSINCSTRQRHRVPHNSRSGPNQPGPPYDRFPTSSPFLPFCNSTWITVELQASSFETYYQCSPDFQRPSFDI